MAAASSSSSSGSSQAARRPSPLCRESRIVLMLVDELGRNAADRKAQRKILIQLANATVSRKILRESLVDSILESCVVDASNQSLMQSVLAAWSKMMMNGRKRALPSSVAVSSSAAGVVKKRSRLLQFQSSAAVSSSSANRPTGISTTLTERVGVTLQKRDEIPSLLDMCTDLLSTRLHMLNTELPVMSSKVVLSLLKYADADSVRRVEDLNEWMTAHTDSLWHSFYRRKYGTVTGISKVLSIDASWRQHYEAAERADARKAAAIARKLSARKQQLAQTKADRAVKLMAAPRGSRDRRKRRQKSSAIAKMLRESKKHAKRRTLAAKVTPSSSKIERQVIRRRLDALARRN